MRVLIACLALVGCAAQQPRLPPEEQAKSMSAAELCIGRSTWSAYSAGIASAELERRGVNCADHAAGIQQLQADRAAAIGALLSRQPVPVQIAPVPLYQVPTSQCRTWWDGAAYRTSCQ